MQTQSTVTPSAASALGEETLFLDVREIGEYEQGHIGGAIALPLSQISSPAVRRMLREGERCVVVCKGGMRARKAAQMLGAAGIGNLHILGRDGRLGCRWPPGQSGFWGSIHPEPDTDGRGVNRAHGGPVRVLCRQNLDPSFGFCGMRPNPCRAHGLVWNVAAACKDALESQ